MSEQCNANEVDKQLLKLSFRDKGIGVGFGSIKHWLIMDNLALHNQLFTSVEILEMTTSGGGQHLDSAEGVSSLFPGQSVRVTTPRTSASTTFTSTIWKCQDDNASLYKLSITKHMHCDSFSKDLDIHLDLMAFRDGVLTK